MKIPTVFFLFLIFINGPAGGFVTAIHPFGGWKDLQRHQPLPDHHRVIHQRQKSNPRHVV